MNSISGITLRLFNSHYNKLKIKTKISTTEDEAIRFSFHGGRCEPIGNPYSHESIFHFDFTGMYNLTMKEDFPMGKFTLEHPTEVKKIGFYDVIVKSNMELPILPYKDLESGKLLFPNGVFEGLF